MFGVTKLSKIYRWLASAYHEDESAPPASERRTLSRRRVQFPVVIQDPAGNIPAVGIDYHAEGVQIVAGKPWPEGALLFLDLKGLRRMGFAVVRHCTVREDWNYSIGLRFQGEPMRQEVGEWRIERVCRT